jgi:hypothetical protein
MEVYRQNSTHSRLRYPLYRRLGGPQSRYGRYGLQINLRPYRESKSDSQVIQSIDWSQH